MIKDLPYLIFCDAFSRLSSSQAITEEDKSILEYLVCLVFCKDKSIKSVDKGKLHLHQKGQPFERLPPSKGASIYNIKRAVYQGIIWRQSLNRQSLDVDPLTFGYKINEKDFYTPHWTDLPPTTTINEHFVECGCKTPCSKYSFRLFTTKEKSIRSRGQIVWNEIPDKIKKIVHHFYHLNLISRSIF